MDASTKKRSRTRGRTRAAVLGLALAAALSAGCRREAPAPLDRRGAQLAPVAAGTGGIEGAVQLTSVPPLPPPLPTNASAAHVCGVSVPDGSLVVGEGGRLANVVVWIDAPATPGPDKVLPTGRVDQRGCRYLPQVLAARAGSHLTLLNSDELVHTVRTEGTGAGFNFAMPLAGMQVTRLLPKAPGVVRLVCDVHPWMRAVVRTFDHPYFTLTDASGRFDLPGTPAGPRTLHLWHERLGESTLEVRVPAGGLLRLGVLHPRFVAAPQGEASPAP